MTGNPTNTLSHCKFFLLIYNALFWCHYQEHSAMKQWMTQIVKAAKPATSARKGQTSDPFAELNKFFESDPLLRTECPDIITWYGVCLRLLVTMLLDNLAYYFIVEIYWEGVSRHSGHGSWLYGNTGILLPCRMFILDVSSYRWCPSTSDEEREVWSIAEVMCSIS